MYKEYENINHSHPEKYIKRELRNDKLIILIILSQTDF